MSGWLHVDCETRETCRARFNMQLGNAAVRPSIVLLSADDSGKDQSQLKNFDCRLRAICLGPVRSRIMLSCREVVHSRQ